MRVVFAAALAVAFSGCFFDGHCGLQVSSATWTQPGLYEAMANASGPNVTTSLDEPGPGLPFDDAKADATWSQGRLVSVSMDERRGFFTTYARLTAVPASDPPLLLTLGSHENESMESLGLFLRHFAYHVTGSEEPADAWLRAASGNTTQSEESMHREGRGGDIVVSRPLERWAHVNATLRVDELFAGGRGGVHERGGTGQASLERNGLQFQFEFPVREVTQGDLTIRADPRGPAEVHKDYGEVSEEVVRADLEEAFDRLGLPEPTFDGFGMSGKIC